MMRNEKIKNKEREAQRALGTSKIYRVHAEIPLRASTTFSTEVHAISEEDAKTIVKGILKNMTVPAVLDYINRQKRHLHTNVFEPVHNIALDINDVGELNVTFTTRCTSGRNDDDIQLSSQGHTGQSARV